MKKGERMEKRRKALGIPARYDDGPTCKRCGEHLRRRTKDMICGFCEQARKRGFGV